MTRSNALASAVTLLVLVLSAAPELGARQKLHLRQGDFVDVRVDQDGADVRVVLLGPDGASLRSVDTPTGEKGPEFLWWVAQERGDYRLEVHGADSPGGYRVVVAPPRPAGELDVLRAKAQGHHLRGQRHLDARETELAGVELAAARRLWERLGDRFQLVLVLADLGRTASVAHRLDEAVAYYEHALEVVTALGDGQQQVRVLNLLGLAERHLANHEAAAASYRAALELAERGGHLRGRGTAAHNLGALYHLRGETETSLAFYEQARDVWREVGDTAREVRTLRSMSDGYMLLGRLTDALEVLHEALRIVDEKDHTDLARMLNSIGWLHYLRDESQEALKFYDRALEIRADVEPDSTTAASHDRKGSALVDLGRWREASAAYDEALAIVGAGGHLASQGHTLANVCRLQELTGRSTQALSTCERSLAILRKVDDGPAVAWVLYLSARLERGRGDLRAAQTNLSECVDLVDRLRAAAGDEALRLSFFAGRLDFYELYVDVLMDLHAADRATGWNVRALEVAERGRARGLLDRLAEAGAGARDADPRPIDVPAMQALLDRDTVLLAFALGDERGFAWRVTQTGVESEVLASRQEIERDARAWYGLLSDPRRQESGRGQRRALAKTLSDELLRLVAKPPAAKRLIFLGDGALHYLPFGALPLPGGGADEPLVARYEVLSLPSVSALAALRRRLADREPAPGLVAVVADPVFDDRDERLEHRVAHGTATPPESRRFDRLPGTRREAAAILKLAPGARTLELQGFDAHRERILSGELAGYRIVHFATHGVLEANRPELSGLALSGIDERGRPRPAFLRFHEISALDLPAELAVLSACKTALGPEVRGEGLIGLTRAFHEAGVPRLVVSLWNVEDGSAAELVERFYRGLFAQGLEPAAALRAAQHSMWREGRWSPYQWAGFVLQGEWRGFKTRATPE